MLADVVTSYLCSFMSWFIIFKMCLGSNTSAHKSARSLPISLRTAGSLYLDIVLRATFIWMPFRYW